MTDDSGIAKSQSQFGQSDTFEYGGSSFDTTVQIERRRYGRLEGSSSEGAGNEEGSHAPSKDKSERRDAESSDEAIKLV